MDLASISNIIAFGAIIFFFIYWLHAFVILYHLIRFGVGTRPKQAAFLFFCGSSALFVLLLITVALTIIPQ